MRRGFASWSAHIDRLQEQTDENIRFLRALSARVQPTDGCERRAMPR